MFGSAQPQADTAFGATNNSAPAFGFGQQPSSGAAPSFGQSAPTPAFGQAPDGMVPTFSGAYGGASGPSGFAAGTSSNAPASRRRVAVRRSRR